MSRDYFRGLKVDLASGAATWAYTGEYTARPDGIASAIALSQGRQHVYLARNRPGQLWRVDLAQAADWFARG